MEQQQKGVDEPIQKRPRTAVEGTVKIGVKSTDKNEDDVSSASLVPDIPTFDNIETISSQDFLQAYKKYQAVLLKGASKYLANVGANNQEKQQQLPLTWKDIGSIFEALNAEDKESWCIENRGENKDRTLTPEVFLAPQIIPEERAYCSFLVQKDKAAYRTTLGRLPVPNLGTLEGDNDNHKWTYEPCLWIFFGRNTNATTPPKDKNNVNSKMPLEGRGLHTDSVSHDGTWHYQTSGIKEWYLSPSSELLHRHWKLELSEHEQRQWKESTQLRVNCHEGDVIVVNTRLWFHRTVIPAQETPSVSYARDFQLSSRSSPRGSASGDNDKDKDNQDATSTTMTNLDGLYARNEIEAGTVIFTEHDMPDCELHRSNDNPNCQVVELEDGTSAVVSCRAIASGEFFCVPESSDEEGEDYDEEEEEEDFDDEDDE